MKAKKILSLLLCTVMLVGLFPASAFANSDAVSVTIGENTVNYSSIEEALENGMADGAQFKLLTDITLSMQLNISKNISLDLGEYSISGELDTVLLNISATEFCLTGKESKGIVNSKGPAMQLGLDTVLTVGDLGSNSYTFTFESKSEENPDEGTDESEAELLELPVKFAVATGSDSEIAANAQWFSYVDSDGKRLPNYIVIEGNRNIADKALIENGQAKELYLIECDHADADAGTCPACGTEHIHNRELEALENTIKATCANEDGLCPAPEQKVSLNAPENLIYDGQLKEPVIDGKIDGMEIKSEFPQSAILPGDYSASISIGDVKAQLSFTIVKASPEYTAPTAKTGLVYNASAQELITAGSATNGEMQYSLDNETYSTEIPTATEAGEHAVWYKVVGSEGYSDIDAQSIKVVIGLPAPTFTAPTAKTNLTYTASAQQLITAGTATGGEMQYSLDNEIYSTEIPTATEPGKYTVWYKVVGSEGYSNVEAASIEVEIAKAEPEYTAPTGLSAVYGQTLADVSLSEGWSWKDASTSSVGNAGTNKFVAIFTPDDTENFSAVEKELEISVSKKAISISDASIEQKFYDGKKTASVSSVSLDGVLDGETLVLGTDFTVSGEFNDANTGDNKTVTLTLTLLDSNTAKNYSISGSYTLSGQSISANTNAPTATLSFDKVTYNGSVHKPSVTVKIGETTIPAAEYEVTYSDNTNAGTAKVTVTDNAGGNFSFDTIEKTFTIEKAKLIVAPKAVSVNRGANPPKLEYTVTGIISGEKIGANANLEFKLYNSAGTEVTAANAVNTAGTYTIKWTNMSSIKFTKVENYDVTKVETADFIVKAPASTSTTTNTSSNNNSSTGSTNTGSNSGNTASNTIKPSPTPTASPKPSVSVPISGYTKTIRVDASLEGNTVNISSVDMTKLDSVIGEKVDTKIVSIDLSQLSSSKDITTVKFPTTVIKEIADAANDSKNDVEALIILLGDGTSIGFDADALNGKASQAKGNDISISVEPASKSKNLTAAQKSAVGSHVAYDISVLSGGKLISDLGGTISVYAPYSLKAGEQAEGIVVYYVDNDGNRHPCSTSYDSAKKQVVWTTDHLSLYVIDYVEATVEAPAENETPADEPSTPTPIDPEKKDNKDLKAIFWILLIGIVLMTGGLFAYGFIQRRRY